MVGDGSRRRRRWWASAATRRTTLLTVPLLVILGTAAVGNAAAPALVEDRPTLLLALNATTRHLLLTSTSVAVVPWVLIGLARRLVEDPFLYLLGRWHGDDALAWVERRAGGGRWLQLVQRRFRLLGYPLVAIAPGGLVCLLAGASGMRPIPFLALDLIGTLVVLAALRSFGAEATAPIDATVSLIGEHAVPLTAVSAAATVLWVRRRRRATAPPRPSDP